MGDVVPYGPSRGPFDRRRFGLRRRLSESFEEAYHAGAGAGIVFSVIGIFPYEMFGADVERLSIPPITFLECHGVWHIVWRSIDFLATRG